MLRLTALLLAMTLSVTATWAAPYDETADAKAQVAAALTTAKQIRKPVLVLFGANWCGDCVALDSSLKSEKNAALMAQSFILLKVDIGEFNRNLDLAKVYGNPIKMGIPAAVLLSPNNDVLYATKAGELANARRMSETGVYDFFQNLLIKTGS